MLLRIDVLTPETCWALNKEIIKQVTSIKSVFTQIFHIFRGWIFLFRKMWLRDTCLFWYLRSVWWFIKEYAPRDRILVLDFFLLLSDYLSDFAAVYSLCVSVILSLHSERVRWVCALLGQMCKCRWAFYMLDRCKGVSDVCVCMYVLVRL